MRAVVTRVNHASVTIDGEVHGKIQKGLLVLLGIHRDDTEKEAEKIADKICGLRIFEDENGKMNLAPDKVGAELMIISQFTLFADCRSRRPDFLSLPDRKLPFLSMSWSSVCAEKEAFVLKQAFLPQR